MIGALEANGLEMWRTPVFFPSKKIQKTYVWSWGGPFISELEMCFHITSKGSWECPKCIFFMSSPKLKEDRYPRDTEKPSLFFNHIFFRWVSSYEKKNVVSTKISTRPPCRRVTLAAGSAGSKPTSRAQGTKRTKGACGSIIGDDKGFPSLHGPPSN